MLKKYDLIVIGSGPAGTDVAKSCAKKGLKVAVADYLFGGTCALKGCTPKKAMESVTSLWWETQHLQGHGFPKTTKPVKWKKLVAHSQEFTALVPSGKKRDLKKAKIDLIEKKVSFIDKKTITDGDNKWTAKNIVIATGAIPRPLDIPGKKHLLNSADFFELSKLPKSIVFIGGGYIAFELAHIAAACGSQVTIISDTQKPLKAFDTNLVSQFIKATLDKGIDVRLGYQALSVSTKRNKYEVVIQRKGRDKNYGIPADVVFNTTGRIPATKSLNLAKADIQLDKKGFPKFNEYLQCKGNNAVYLVGDVNNQSAFTPVAHLEAATVAKNILNKKKEKINYPTIPFALYGYPKLAGVGQTEKQLKEAGIEYKTFSKSLTDDLIEKAKHNKFAGFRVFVDSKTDKILGAYILSAKADDSINLIATAIQKGLTGKEVHNLILAYPTASQVVRYMVT